MHIYIQALDYQLQRVTIKGSYTPTIKVDGKDVLKPEEDWDELDMKFIELNAKAINILYYTLDANEFNHISTYLSTKKIQDRLEDTYEEYKLSQRIQN